MAGKSKDAAEMILMFKTYLGFLQEHERVAMFQVLSDRYCSKCGQAKIPERSPCGRCEPKK